MDWWLAHKFDEKRGFLEKRARIMRGIRGFFETRGFIEVETPALQVCPTFDTHIHAFQTDLKGADGHLQRKMYLHTSPELDMKKLLVAGMPRIFQICHVYRNRDASRLHAPEFTLLEWYRAQAGYREIMDDCVDMLRHVAENMGIQTYTHQGKNCDPFKDWQIISVAQAFEKYAGIDLGACLEDAEKFAAVAAKAGVRVIEADRWDDIFHAVMAAKIEPYLGTDVPAILYDYPVSMAALSRRCGEDPRYAERFELYVCGVELANAFGELTDAAEQKARFEAEMKAKQELYGEEYPPDEAFFKALEHGMPDAGGIALGIDRLVMLATGAEDISQVLWSPVQA